MPHPMQTCCNQTPDHIPQRHVQNRGGLSHVQTGNGSEEDALHFYVHTIACKVRSLTCYLSILIVFLRHL